MKTVPLTTDHLAAAGLWGLFRMVRSNLTRLLSDPCSTGSILAWSGDHDGTTGKSAGAPKVLLRLGDDIHVEISPGRSPRNHPILAKRRVTKGPSTPFDR